MKMRNVKKLIYILCFCMLCIIDQRIKTGSGLDGVIESFRDSIGLVTAVIILSHYVPNDIKRSKTALGIWGIVGIFIGIAAFFMLREWFYFPNDRFILSANIYLHGFVLIFLIRRIGIDRVKPVLNKRLFALWLLMFIWMNFSRSDYIWPLVYLFMFGCMLLTDFSEAEEEQIFEGAADGIILSFILFGIFSCMFRPYNADQGARYTGIYNNPNLYAEYICVVTAAVIYRVLAFYKDEGESAKLWKKLIAWAMLGIVLSFQFFSISRSGAITTCVLLLLFLFFYKLCIKRSSIVKNIILTALSFAVCMPLCFLAIRYMPPVFHHPIWFWGEWNEGKVHSFDPWNSDKYVSFDYLMNSTVARVLVPFNNMALKLGITDELLMDGGENMSEEDYLWLQELTPQEEEQLMAERGAVLHLYEEANAFLLRKTIYAHYIKNLNLLGHPQSEQGLQTTIYSWVGHAHDIYLQYATDFGVPMAVMFIVFFAWCGIILFNRARGGNITALLELMFMLMPLIFGVFEYSWGSGSVESVLMFMVPVFAMRKTNG